MTVKIGSCGPQKILLVESTRIIRVFMIKFTTSRCRLIRRSSLSNLVVGVEGRGDSKINYVLTEILC